MQATTTATVAAAASLAQRWSQAAIAVACNMAGNILAMYWLKSYACDWQQQQQRSVCSFWSFTNRNCIDFAVAAASAAVAAIAITATSLALLIWPSPWPALWWYIAAKLLNCPPTTTVYAPQVSQLFHPYLMCSYMLHDVLVVVIGQTSNNVVFSVFFPSI